MKDSQVDHWLDNPHFGAGSFRRSRPRSGFSSNGGSTANVSPRSSVGSSHSTNSINHGPALDCRPTWRTPPVSRTFRHSNLDPTSMHALGRSSIRVDTPQGLEFRRGGDPENRRCSATVNTTTRSASCEMEYAAGCRGCADSPPVDPVVDYFEFCHGKRHPPCASNLEERPLLGSSAG